MSGALSWCSLSVFICKTKLCPLKMQHTHMHTSTTVQTTTAAGEPWNTKRAGNRHCFAFFFFFFFFHTHTNSTFPYLPFCLKYLKCSGQAFTKCIHYSVNWDSCYQRNICFILFNSFVSCMNICMTLAIYFVVLVSFLFLFLSKKNNKKNLFMKMIYQLLMKIMCHIFVSTAPMWWWTIQKSSPRWERPPMMTPGDPLDN